jgi:hypothetical protein
MFNASPEPRAHMAFQQVHSVTYSDGEGGNIHVEVYDRHADALARRDAIAATGARVLVQPHMLTVRNNQQLPHHKESQ